MKLFLTDPRLLASLFADADNDAIGERIWHPDELAAILRHQMTTPLHVDLAGIEGAAKRLHDAAGASGLILKSFGDLLQHPHPPLALLKMMKDFAKACRISPESALPREISSVIYFASIIAAMTRHSRRITKLDNAALRDAVDWALAQPWLDEISRGVFLEGRQFFLAAQPAGRAASGSEIGKSNPEK